MPGLDPALTAALDAAAAAPAVLLASDFDGTLAPFHDDPMAVRPDPDAMAALRLAAGLPGVTVALVSGRDLATLGLLGDVTPEAPGERIVLVGSHGGQSSHPAVVASDGLTDDQVALLATLDAELKDVAAAHPGARVEVKAAARVLHTRGMPADDAAAALAQAREVGARHPGVHVMAGKNVLELSVLDASKGTALRRLAEAVGASVTVYLGDDLTDETAFRALDPSRGDVTVKVGDGDGVARALQHFAAARQARADMS